MMKYYKIPEDDLQALFKGYLYHMACLWSYMDQQEKEESSIEDYLAHQCPPQLNGDINKYIEWILNNNGYAEIKE